MRTIAIVIVASMIVPASAISVLASGTKEIVNEYASDVNLDSLEDQIEDIPKWSLSSTTGNLEADGIINDVIKNDNVEMYETRYKLFGKDNKLLAFWPYIDSSNYRLYIYPLTGSDGIMPDVGGDAYPYPAWEAGTIGITEVQIADGIKTIGDKSFYQQYRIEKVTLPDSLENIGDYAFCYCEAIKTINLGKVKNVGAYALYSLEILEELDLSSIVSIGEYAFYMCGHSSSSNYSLTIPGTAKSIGDYAFLRTAIKELTISEGVTAIPDHAFDMQYEGRYSDIVSDGRMEKITIADSVESIGKNAFAGCYENYSTSFSQNVKNELLLGNGIKSIGEDAFLDAYVRNLYYAGSISDWLDIKFANEKSNPMYAENPLDYFRPPIDYNLFIGGNKTDAVKSIVIPDTVTKIPDYAFYGLTAIDELEVPASVTSIGKKAFYDSHITDLYIYSKSCTLANEYPFAGGRGNYATFHVLKNSTAYNYLNSYEDYDVSIEPIDDGSRIDAPFEERSTLQANIESNTLGTVSFRFEDDKLGAETDKTREYFYNFLYVKNDRVASESYEWVPMEFTLNGEKTIDLPTSYYDDVSHKDNDVLLFDIEDTDFNSGVVNSRLWMIQKVAYEQKNGINSVRVFGSVKFEKGSYGDSLSTYSLASKTYTHSGAVDTDYGSLRFVKRNYGSWTDYASTLYMDSDETTMSANAHVGEDTQITLALSNDDCTTPVLLSDLVGNSKYSDITTKWTLEYYEVDTNGVESIEKDASGEYAEIIEESDEKGFAYWIRGKRIPSAEFTYLYNTSERTGKGRMYIHVQVSGSAIGTFDARIPFWILPAKSGVRYRHWDDVTDVCFDLESAKQAALDGLVARKSDEEGGFSVYVEENVSGSLNFDDIFNLYEERAEMKPYEGEYEHFTIGLRNEVEGSFDTMNIEDDVWHDDVLCTKYTFTAPHITTRAEEDKVDEIIDNLLSSGGALYSVKNGTNEQKAKAAFDWVIGHVSGSVGKSNSASERRQPINHTAYTALTKGYATCEGFALLYSRLCRELGVPARVIAGTDANAHTYNIVLLDDGYYYYVDTSAKLWKKDYTSFTRTTEQNVYRNTKFIRNYIRKIKGYTDGSTGKIIEIIDAEGNVVASEGSLLSAKLDLIDIIDGLKTSGKLNSDTKYTIKLINDVKSQSWEDLDYMVYTDDASSMGMDGLPIDEYFFVKDYSDYVEIDLNGHKVTVPANSKAQVRATKVKNGVIQLNTYSDLWLVAPSSSLGEKISNGIFENVKINGDKTQYVQVYPGVVVKESCGIQNVDRLVLFYHTQIDCDTTVKRLEMGWEGYTNSPIILNGNINTQYMYLFGSTLNPFYEDRFSWESGEWFKPNPEEELTLRVNGTLNVSDGAKIQYNTITKVYGNLNIAGKLYMISDYSQTSNYYYDDFTSDYYKNYINDTHYDKAFPAEIMSVRKYDSKGSLVESGYINISASIINEYELGCNDGSKYAGELYDYPGLVILPWKVQNNVESIDELKKGEVIATIGLKKGIRYEDGKTEKPIRDIFDLAKYINVIDASSTALIDDRMGSVMNKLNCDEGSLVYSSAKAKVTFDPMGGKLSVASKKIYAGGIYGEMPTPVWSGKEFVGWFTAPEGGTIVKSTDIVADESTIQDITLYAHWAFSIVYNLNGGTNDSDNPTSFLSGENLLINAPIREGYTFNGWFENERFTGNMVTSTTGRRDTIKIYAKWTANVYKIVYESNVDYTASKIVGANSDTLISGNMTPSLVKYDAAVKLPKPGYTSSMLVFTGWNTKADGSGNTYSNQATVKNLRKGIDASTDIEVTSDTAMDGDKIIRLYAQWNGTTYNVKYDANASSTVGKASGKVVNSKFKFFEDHITQANNYKIKGYRFVGWNTRADGRGIWAAKAESGESSSGIDNLYQNAGTDEAVIPGLGVRIDNLAGKTNATLNLYAQWEPITYHVEIYRDEDSFKNDTKEYEFDMTYGQNIVDALAAAGKDQMTLSGAVLKNYGYRDARGKLIAVKTNASNLSDAEAGVVKIFGVWAWPSYKISYNLAGGKYPKGAAKNPSNYKLNSNNMTFVKPTCDGYTFDGWYLPNGTTKVTTLDNLKSVIDSGDYAFSNVKLTAKWNPIRYKVRFYPNSGVYSQIVVTDGSEYVEEQYLYDEEIDLVEVAQKFTVQPLESEKSSQLHIAGWAVDNKTGSKAKYIIGKNYSKLSKVAYSLDADSEVGVINLYAVPGPRTYRISYELNGGINNKSNPKTYIYNEKKAVILKKPVRTGYVFEGWGESYNEETHNWTMVDSIAKGRYGNVSITALYRPVSYTVNLKINNKKTDFKEGVDIEYQNITYDSTVGINASELIKENQYYDFVGWNTKPNGKGIWATKSDGTIAGWNDLAELKGLGTKDKSRIVLYAVWKSKEYSVKYVNIDPEKTYNSESENTTTLSKVVNKSSVRYSADKNLKFANPSKYGFIFKGWFEDGATSTQRKYLPAWIAPDGKYTDGKTTGQLEMIDTDDDGVKDTIVIYGKWVVK